MMLKLLIADDERIERDALRYIITRESSTIGEISEAANGKEAIEKTFELKPDIIFLDIKMPGISGLDAARRIKAELPEARLVFLTAFDYFDYAHEAIRIGVEDFIVKPASDERVMEVIARISSEIEKQRTLADRQRGYERRLEQVSTLLEAELIDDLVQQSLGLEQLESCARVLEIDSIAGFPVCVALDFDSYPMAVGNDSRRAVLKRRTLQRIGRELDGFRMLGNCNYATLYMLILCAAQPDPCPTVQKLLERAIAAVWREVSLRISVGLGEHIAAPDGYAEGFVHARIALESATPKEPLMCWKEPDRSGRQAVRYPYELERTLIRRVLSGDVEQALQLVDEVLERLNEIYGDRRTLKRKLHEMIAVVTREAGFETDELDGTNRDLLEQLEATAHAGELRGLVRSLIRSLAHAASPQSRDASHSATEQIRRHIDEHYSEDLSLEQAAAMVRLSPYYFSKMFKLHQGANFVDYVNGVRVSRARDLLRHSRLNIKEIAQAVGFADANYFSRVFKRHELVTPTAYRSRTVR